MSDKTSFIPEISLNDLMEIVGDDVEALQDIIGSFLHDSPKLLRLLQEGLSSKDGHLIERNAHTLKSSSRLFQAENFALQCQVIEGLARQSDWEAIAVNIAQLEENFQLLAQVLKTELDKL